MRELDTWQNLTSTAVPPCLVTENGAPCDREGRYWLTVSSTHGARVVRYSLGACTEHVAAARELGGTDAATFVVEQVTTRHPFYEEAPDGG